MGNLLRKRSADWGYGCGRSTCCEPKRAHQALQQSARRREDREWQAEAEKDVEDQWIDACRDEVA